MRYTVGSDPVLDLDLVRWDAIGSAAHAKMLNRIGILNADECGKLVAGLRRVVELSDAGEFEIPYDLEDCHTAIEMFLLEHAGDAALKIHTGRSRNDQVLLTVRLYLRDACVNSLSALHDTANSFLVRAKADFGVMMPGYTHLQTAMPSSIGMWLGAFTDAQVELLDEGLALLEIMDKNPLGAASGFGVPLELDRKYTAELLGFSKVQRNPIETQNSRGRYELRLVRWLTDVSALFEKFSWDLILYSTHEFGFFSLPKELTTGSSIMPQKRNPDVLELTRARASVCRGALTELSSLTDKLPSNYHRDFQLTKAPLFRALREVSDILPMMQLVVGEFTINSDAISRAMTADIFATYDVYRQVRDGRPFREAYRNTHDSIQRGLIDAQALAADFKIIADSVSSGLEESVRELDAVETRIDAWKSRLAQVERIF